MGKQSDTKKTIKQKITDGPFSARKAKTPDANIKRVKTVNKTPKSAPPLKRKKLSEEIDEEISDEEFDAVFQELKAKEKNKRLLGKVTPKSGKKAVKKVSTSEDDSDEDGSDGSFDFENGEDSSNDDYDKTGGSDDEDGDESEDDDDDDDDGSDVSSSEMANILKQLTKDGSEEDDEDEDEDGEEDEEEEKDEDQKKKKGKASGKNKPGKVKDVVSKEAAQAVYEEKAARDRRTLFIKNLPTDVKESEIKEVAPVCLDIRIKHMKNKKQVNRGYALLEFKNEAVADTYYKKLDKATVRGNKLVVDYVGAKSILRPFNSDKAPKPEELDPLKLYVRGLPHNITEETLKTWFPEATEVGLPRRVTSNRPCGFAFIHFKSPKLCSSALKRVNGQKVDGKTLSVYHAKKKSLKQLKKIAEAKNKMAEAGKRKVKHSKLATNTSKSKGKKRQQEQIDRDTDDDDDDDEAGDSDGDSEDEF